MRFQTTMASLTIPFPEGTRTIGLRGKRITIGRLPDNTVQIRDRTISAYHAELIEEGDHYRLRDNGSTNGVVVNGQRIADFHLRENCKVSIGGVICDFVAAQQENRPDEVDQIPSRSEMQTILQANSDLRSEIASLRGQVETMTKAREESGGEGQTVSLAEHDQLAQELTTLRSTLQDRQTQLDRLTSLLAIATREKEALQKGYDDACSALDKAREAAPGVVEKPAPQMAKLATPAGVAANRPTERLVPGAASAFQAPRPAVQTAVAAAPQAPAVPVPQKPTAVPGVSATPSVPSAPRPTAVPAAARMAPPSAPGVKPVASPSAPATPSPAAPSAAKPLPKPPGALGSGPSRRPASAVQPAPAKPTVAPASALASAGPKGTQKLVE